ncbi:G2/mitotic-specific cyclin-1 [Dionaea muscipula]
MDAGKVTRRGRRALGVIDQNLEGAQPYPCVVNKRPMPQKIAVYDGSLSNPVQRPITRRYAAEIASTQQQQQQHNCVQEKKKLDPSSHSSKEVEDCKLIAVEECNIAAMDLRVSMSPEQTQAAADQINEMEEVEMEDIFEDAIMDIDGRDLKNPLAVVDYVEDLYSHYKKTEGCSGVSADYMVQQLDINEKMRAILVDWLIEVHYKFELRDETLFLTVNIIDRFLERQKVARKKLQLVGLIALLLACKYEEVSVPVVDDLIFISDNAYTRRDLLDMEKSMLNTLQFNLSTPTPYVFMRRFLKAAESDEKLELLSSFLMELSLVEYEMLKYSPSQLAAAAVYTAQCTVYGFKHWNKTCQWHTNYSEHQLLECCRHMVGFHQKAGTGKLSGVHRKYSTSRFGYAAKCAPALFLLE